MSSFLCDKCHVLTVDYNKQLKCTISAFLSGNFSMDMLTRLNHISIIEGYFVCES